MPHPPASKPAAAPLDTLRMSQEDKHKLVEYVESQGRQVSDSRRRLRIDFHGRKVFGRLFGSEGRGPMCSLVPRNVSTRGFSFVHGVFVNVGMRCRLTLPMLGNRWCEVEGTVLRCRHVQGIVHEVSLVFDDELDLAELVNLTPAQARRLEAESLAGRGVSPQASEAPAPQGAGGGCVLLVDPDAGSRPKWAAALEKARFAVTTCGSHHAARQAVASGFPGGGRPVAVVLVGGAGRERPGVAELRFDPIALAGHLRGAGIACPILLRPLPAESPDAAERLRRRAALSGVTEVLGPAIEVESLCKAVQAHIDHAEEGRGRSPLRSLAAGRPSAHDAIAAFTRRVPGYRERLRRPGTAENPESLRSACESALVEATDAGFPAAADAARSLLRAIEGGGSAREAIEELDSTLARVEAARAAA